MEAPRVLMTGATGSFGRSVALELLANGCELVLVVRGRTDTEARRRAHAALGYGGPDVEVVRGDLEADQLGLTRAGRALARTADVVVHAAASTEFGLPLDAARRVNVGGTRNVLSLAHRIPRLRKLVHVSTAFVAGKRCGHVLEPELHDAGFVNSYEHAKHEAERLVRAHSRALPLAVVRPSLVLDPPGATGTSAFRFALQLIARGLVTVLPGAPANPLDVIPADDAAAATVRIALDRGAFGTFHVASGDRAPSVGDIVRVGARRRVRFVEQPRYADELAAVCARHPHARRSYDALATFIELLAYAKTFDTARTERVLGRHPCSGDPLDAVSASVPVARNAS